MEELKDPVVETPAVTAPPARPRRRWLRGLVYLLAAVGALALALIGFLYWRGAHGGGVEIKPRVAIDEATMVETVMTDAYGKYSETKKGWLYVGDDNVTYLMRVVQRTKIPDGEEGDELYFVASGAATDGSDRALYGAFRVYPTQPYDGGLSQANVQIHYASSLAVRPEQVHFEALSDTLWGWVVKTQDGNDPVNTPVTTMNTVLAPHGDEIAVVAEFLAAHDAQPATPCDEAKAAWDAYADPHGEMGDDEEEPEEPIRCDKRRWTYRTGTVGGSVPVPITVTMGGTQDGKPVEARSWKLMFDPKSFSYNVPDELKVP